MRIMTTRTEFTTRGGAFDRLDRSVGRLALALLFVAAGFGLAQVFPTDSGPNLIGRAQAAELMVQDGSGSDGDYSFFTNRRYLWIVKRSTGQAQFFHIPESKNSEQPPINSRVYQIEGDDFPLDQVRYQASERNLEFFLWVTNPQNGKTQFVRARRDGGFDESPITDASDM